ncbi:MAG: type III-B CRISPR module-associated protein Cmr3 [Gammaproteobacteria bacterium]|nr:type III-B CRISPR module-associated protein Cmr3 [Gammaproteobacteria bacterium]
MNTVYYRFIEPLDVLFLRGNKLFGDPGSFGESLIPPWPSVAAGAIRTRMLADDNVDLAAFARDEIRHPVLGTPSEPGTFTMNGFYLARRTANGIELLVAPPADLVISKKETDELVIHPLTSTHLNPLAGVMNSAPLPGLPVLAEQERSKPASGYWLKQSGWEKYLAGQTPSADDFIHASELWQIDPRVGVGLDADMRRAADGKLFTVQAVAMRPNVGFIAGVSGAEPPGEGMLRLGGDGRAAAIRPADNFDMPHPDYEAIAQARCCRIVLTSPGIFPEGWKLSGTGDDNSVAIGGINARLVCAAVSRAEIVSGWDLAANNGRGEPKPAQRVAPTGSVYWLDEVDATPDALRKLVETGLWCDPGDNPSRRAEGFNRAWLATWK